MATISERVFEKLSETRMSQKEFSERTGIMQSTISEWKKKKTNPSSDKIMSICKTLNVSPEWLLSGVEPAGGRVSRLDYYIIDKKSEQGDLIYAYEQMDTAMKQRLRGYMDALTENR